MNKLLTFTCALGLGAVLSGCLLPEKFSLSVKISNDGGYSYLYEGVTAFVPAVAQINGSGESKSSPKLDDQLRQEAVKLRKEPDFQKADYIGDGRFNLKIAGTRQSGQSFRLLDVLTLSRAKDGLITLSSIALTAKDAETLKTIGLKMDGKLELTIPKNAQVISTNATSKPGWFSSTYSWKIGSVDERPMMQIRFTQ